MRATTVRFDESLWNMLEGEARTQGVSAAQFVRDATILRVAALAAQRGDEDTKLTVEAVAQGALRARAASSSPGNGGAPGVPPEVLDPARVRAVRESGLLELVGGDEAFDRLARLATRILETPVALVSLIDHDRQVFLGMAGIGEPWSERRETPLTHSVCQHPVAAREPLIVPDVREHPLLRTNTALQGFGVLAYAGAPLFDDDGHALGTLCVFDRDVREWTDADRDSLLDLASSAMSEMRLRASRRA